MYVLVVYFSKCQCFLKSERHWRKSRKWLRIKIENTAEQNADSSMWVVMRFSLQSLNNIWYFNFIKFRVLLSFSRFFLSFCYLLRHLKLFACTLLSNISLWNLSTYLNPINLPVVGFDFSSLCTSFPYLNFLQVYFKFFSLLLPSVVWLRISLLI